MREIVSACKVLSRVISVNKYSGGSCCKIFKSSIENQWVHNKSSIDHTRLSCTYVCNQ